MTNPLKSEESFQKFVNGLCCNGCKFYVDKKCTEINSKAHEIDKAWTIQESLNEYLKTKSPAEKEFIDNIDNYYLCEQFESRPQQ